MAIIIMPRHVVTMQPKLRLTDMALMKQAYVRMKAAD